MQLRAESPSLLIQRVDDGANGADLHDEIFAEMLAEMLLEGRREVAKRRVERRVEAGSRLREVPLAEVAERRDERRERRERRPCIPVLAPEHLKLADISLMCRNLRRELVRLLAHPLPHMGECAAGAVARHRELVELGVRLRKGTISESSVSHQ